MNIVLCDICGRQVKREPLENDDLFSEFPNGIFSLDFRPMIIDVEGKPSHYGYRPTCLCKDCLCALNKAIFEKAEELHDKSPEVTINAEIEWPPKSEQMQYRPEPVEEYLGQ